MSRYSHQGPVCVPKGRPLSRDMLLTLYQASLVIDCAAIARRCRISRSTLYRALCGGNARASTLKRIENFSQMWKRLDDVGIASMQRRWTSKRRAADKRMRSAA